MRVKYKVCIAGVGFVINSGDIEDVTKAKADRLIKADMAVVADNDSEITVVKAVISHEMIKSKKKSKKRSKKK